MMILGMRWDEMGVLYEPGMVIGPRSGVAILVLTVCSIYYYKAGRAGCSVMHEG